MLCSREAWSYMYSVMCAMVHGCFLASVVALVHPGLDDLGRLFGSGSGRSACSGCASRAAGGSLKGDGSRGSSCCRSTAVATRRFSSHKSGISACPASGCSSDARHCSQCASDWFSCMWFVSFRTLSAVSACMCLSCSGCCMLKYAGSSRTVSTKTLAIVRDSSLP